jgi:hypothetical protein
MKYQLTVACAALALALGCGQAAADVAPKPLMRVQNVPCPTHVSVVLHPTMMAPGWTTNNVPVALSPDTKNLPRVESNTLICYYAMPDGYNAFGYFQALGGRTCVVRPDNTGFKCH